MALFEDTSSEDVFRALVAAHRPRRRNIAVALINRAAWFASAILAFLLTCVGITACTSNEQESAFVHRPIGPLSPFGTEMLIDAIVLAALIAACMAVAHVTRRR